MGLTNIRMRFANPAVPDRWEEVDCLVDSGAVYSLVPGDLLRRAGIEPHSEREFILANGEKMTRKVGTALFEYQGRRGDSLVIFGEDGDHALLGAVTLEGFGLVLDPFRRELRPLPMILARAAMRATMLAAFLAVTACRSGDEHRGACSRLAEKLCTDLGEDNSVCRDVRATARKPTEGDLRQCEESLGRTAYAELLDAYRTIDRVTAENPLMGRTRSPAGDP